MHMHHIKLVGNITKLIGMNYCKHSIFAMLQKINCHLDYLSLDYVYNDHSQYENKLTSIPRLRQLFKFRLRS
jgi:hypothetical protein